MIKDWLGPSKIEKGKCFGKMNKYRVSDSDMKKNMQTQNQTPIKDDLHSTWNRFVEFLIAKLA